jgi:hypothetical protein
MVQLKPILLILIVLAASSGFSQSKRLDKAIEKGNFYKVERIIKTEIRKHKKGEQYDNGPGSGMQTSFNSSYDSIIHWLLSHKNVSAATWDKCAVKISIYPGWSDIGAVFQTKEGEVEKCFHIQVGTTGQVNLFGWHPKLRKSKKELRYIKMNDCKGFVAQQEVNCREMRH